MKAIRFSLTSLMVAVAFLGLCCAALASRSDFWPSLLSTVAICILMSSLVGVLLGSKETRAFCVGFAVFGWGHLFLVYRPWAYGMLPDFLATKNWVTSLRSLRPKGPKEYDIRNALDQPITLSFNQTPIHEVMEYIRNESDINVITDTVALDEEGVTMDSPVSLEANQVPLKSALHLIGMQLSIVFVVRDDVLLVTTPIKEGERISNYAQRTVYLVFTLFVGLIGGSLSWYFSRRPADR